MTIDEESDCRLIKSMKNGESGFVVPWAISSFNLFKGFSIRGNYTVYKGKGGTVDTFIEKRNNNYYVEIKWFMIKAHLDQRY
jgi:hypothetical protein